MGIQIICVIISTSAFVLVSIGLLIINWMRGDINKLREDLKETEQRIYYKERTQEEHHGMKELMEGMVEKLKSGQQENVQQEIRIGLENILGRLKRLTGD
jgi:predicted Holliday junction resolvase-like endonuclease